MQEIIFRFSKLPTPTRFFKKCLLSFYDDRSHGYILEDIGIRTKKPKKLKNQIPKGQQSISAFFLK